MAKGMRYPHHIETDMGNTVVKFIPSKMATKMHKCPKCGEWTEMFEPHVLLLPTRFTGNRRYMHKDCYEQLRLKNWKVVLHPNLSYLTPSYK